MEQINIHCVQERGYNLLTKSRAPTTTPAMEFIYCPTGWVDGYTELTKSMAARNGHKIAITYRSSKTTAEKLHTEDFCAVIVDGSLDEFAAHWEQMILNNEPLPPVVFVIKDFAQLTSAIGIERVWAAAPYTAEQLNTMFPALGAEYLLYWTGGVPEIIDTLVANNITTVDEAEDYFWDVNSRKNSWMQSGTRFTTNESNRELWRQWLLTGTIMPENVSAETTAHGWTVRGSDGRWYVPRVQRNWMLHVEVK